MKICPKIIHLFLVFSSINLTAQVISGNGSDCSRVRVLPSSTTNIVTLYEHCDMQGRSIGLPFGVYPDISKLFIGSGKLKKMVNFNNVLSSLVIKRGFVARLWNEFNFTGEEDNQNLGIYDCLVPRKPKDLNGGLVFDRKDFNDKTSSLAVFPKNTAVFFEECNFKGNYYILYLDIDVKLKGNGDYCCQLPSNFPTKVGSVLIFVDGKSSTKNSTFLKSNDSKNVFQITDKSCLSDTEKQLFWDKVFIRQCFSIMEK